MTVINTASFAYHQWPLTGQDLSHFLHKVALDNSFNRYACWNENSAGEFLRNVIVGFAPNPIIFANLKKFYFLYGVNSGVSLQKNMPFLRIKISFFQIFLLPFFCAKFCHNLLVFMTILHKKSATLK